jgi:hypothetical protein
MYSSATAATTDGGATTKPRQEGGGLSHGAMQALICAPKAPAACCGGAPSSARFRSSWLISRACALCQSKPPTKPVRRAPPIVTWAGATYFVEFRRLKCVPARCVRRQQRRLGLASIMGIIDANPMEGSKGNGGPEAQRSPRRCKADRGASVTLWFRGR